ncbi:entericidin A/B family lipoprotein [Azospirillum sp. ST 5-10]
MLTFARAGVFATLALLLTACNTVEGIGQDVKAGGNAIERSASEVKSKM